MKYLALATLILSSPLWARTEGPRVSYQWRDLAELKSASDELKGSKASFEQFHSVLVAPIWKKQLLLIHNYNMRYNRFKNIDNWQYNEIHSQSVHKLGLVYYHKEIGGFTPLIFYSHSRDAKFTFDKPLHTYAFGGRIKSSFLNSFIGAPKVSALSLLLRIRQFPNTNKYTPIVRQEFSWHHQRFLLLFPGEFRHTYILEDKREVYYALRLTDKNVFPFEYGPIKGWNTEGNTMAILAGYEIEIFKPLNFAVELGVQTESVDMRDTNNNSIRSYETAPAPWGKIRLVSIF